MAKRKKKKAAINAQVEKTKDRQISLEKKQSSDKSVNQTVVSKPEKSGPKPAKERKFVSIPTCIAGMFLCLVAGIYLGTLLPDVLNKKDIVVSREVPTSPPSSVEQPKEQRESSPAKESAGAPGNLPPGIAAHIKELENSVVKNPQNAEDWTLLGNAYFDTGQFDNAIHAYEHSLELQPNDADVLTDLGIMYRETKRFDKALESFRKASTINPQHINALFNEGVVLAYDLNKKDEAIKAWKKVLQINPDAKTPDGKPLSTLISSLQ